MGPIGQGFRREPLAAGRRRRDKKGRLRWRHAGSDERGRSSLVIYPALALSIAFATNLFAVPGNVPRPSSELADAFA